MNLNELPALPALHDGLRRVDDCMRTTVVANNPALTDVASHLIHAGGKRLRPSLTIAAALTGVDKASDGEVAHDVILAGAAVELIHLGSLHHDDVLDDASTRRGVASVNAKWGNFMAIISGDFLLAKASGLAAKIGIEATERLAETIAELCEGQVLEQQSAFNVDRTRENYKNSISGKTASLLSTATRLGAQNAKLSRNHIDAMTQFGHAFGMAFQIRDDLLDVLGTDEQMGKPTGKDFVEGIYNLPIIFALQDEVHGAQLRKLLDTNIDADRREEILKMVRETKGPSEALEAGRRWGTKAQVALNTLPETEMVGVLRTIAAQIFGELDATRVG